MDEYWTRALGKNVKFEKDEDVVETFAYITKMQFHLGDLEFWVKNKEMLKKESAAVINK